MGVSNHGRARKRLVTLVGAAAAGLGLLAFNAGTAQGIISYNPVRASAYVNSDGGTNADVRDPSECATPDRTDIQAVGKNVHVDACLFSSSGSLVDAPVTFEVRGVGGIFACPDPDGVGGTETSSIESHGTTRHCHQSGYQDKGTDGDDEYHVRVISNRPGQQRVTFCFDPDQNGCADETVKSQVVIGWTGTAITPEN